MDNRKKPIEQQRKYLYESYMGIHGGFCKHVTVLAAEMIGYSPTEIYKNILIYSAYMSCGVTRPEFDTEEERNIFIYESYFGINGRKKITASALAGMFDLPYNEIRNIYARYKNRARKMKEQEQEL